MDSLLEIIRRENRALCEAREPVAIREAVLLAAPDIKPVEATEGKGGQRYRVAKVGHCDRATANRRIYPKAEWALNVERASRDLCPAGKLAGAVDHVGFTDGGNLKHSAILWRSLEIGPDGAVNGEFQVIEGHSDGANLQAQIAAGMAIGFSTSGYGTGREPTDAERKLYGIPDDDDMTVVVQNWTLKKIDAVDDPAVADAWHKRETVNTENAMKTLADLKDKHPDLFAAHEAAVKAATEPLESAKAALEQAKSDLAAKAEAAQTALAAKTAEAEQAQSELTKVQAELEKAKATVAEKEAKEADQARRAAVKAKATELLKANQFAGQISKLIDKAVEAADFDAAKVEALIKDKTAEYAEVAKAAAAGKDDITGIPALAEEQTTEPTGGDPLPIAKELAESL